jgi:hypothetical protein
MTERAEPIRISTFLFAAGARSSGRCATQSTLKIEADSSLPLSADQSRAQSEAVACGLLASEQRVPTI